MINGQRIAEEVTGLCDVTNDVINSAMKVHHETKELFRQHVEELERMKRDRSYETVSEPKPLSSVASSTPEKMHHQQQPQSPLVRLGKIIAKRLSLSPSSPLTPPSASTAASSPQEDANQKSGVDIEYAAEDIQLDLACEFNGSGESHKPDIKLGISTGVVLGGEWEVCRDQETNEVYYYSRFNFAT